MTNPYNSEEVAIARSLIKLERAIALSQGQFSLILASCNHPLLRRQVVNRLRTLCPFSIQELTLHPSAKTLFSTILTRVDGSPPSALMVFGLESVVAIDSVLSATNLVRDEFRKQFPFPLVLWVNDEVLHKLIRRAPDFKNWAATPIYFEVSSDRLLQRVTVNA